MGRQIFSMDFNWINFMWNRGSVNNHLMHEWKKLLSWQFKSLIVFHLSEQMRDSVKVNGTFITNSNLCLGNKLMTFDYNSFLFSHSKFLSRVHEKKVQWVPIKFNTSANFEIQRLKYFKSWRIWTNSVCHRFLFRILFIWIISWLAQLEHLRTNKG